MKYDCSQDASIGELWLELRGMALVRGADLHTAEDVAQETLLRSLCSPPEDRGRMRWWMRRVGERILTETWRKQGHRTAREIRHARPEQVDPERFTEPSPVRRWVDELPERYAVVVRMRFLEERGVDEIAALLERSPEAVRTQIQRGLEKLRERIGEVPSDRSWLLGLVGIFLPGKRASVLRFAGVGVAVTALVASLQLWRASDHPAREVRSSFAEAGGSSAQEDRPRAGSLDPDSSRVSLQTVDPTASEAADVPSLPDPARPRLAGFVRTPQGTPVPGALVMALDEEGNGMRVETDAAGRYEIDVLPHGLLSASHPRWFPSSRTYVASLALGTGIDLVLSETAGRLLVRVVSSDGELAPGATLEARLHGRSHQISSADGQLEYLPSPIRCTTDEAGRAEVPLPVHGSIELFVQAAGHPAWTREIPVESGTALYTITLPTPGVVQGKLVDASFRAYANAPVELIQSKGSVQLESRTDSAGEFRIEGVGPGYYLLRGLEDPARRGSHSFSHLDQLEEGRVHDLGPLELKETHTIHGHVLDGTEPAPGVRVKLVWRDATAAEGILERTTRTDDSGWFAFGGCRKAGHHLFTLPENGAPFGGFAPVWPGPDPVELQLVWPEPLEPVELEWVGPTPRMVELRGEPELSEIIQLQPGVSRCSSRPLPRGSFTVFAWTPESQTTRIGRLEHDPDAPAVHSFSMGEFGEILVEVELPPGVDREQVHVSVPVDAFDGHGLGNLHTMSASRRLAWDPDREAWRGLFPSNQEHRVEIGGRGLAHDMLTVDLESTESSRLSFSASPGVQTRIVFQARRSLLTYEVLNLEVDSDSGTKHIALHWNDQRKVVGGFAFDVSLPPTATEIRALSRPHATFQGNKPLQGARTLAPGDLSGPLEMELVLKKPGD